jgi:hypothetical protein
MLAKLLPLLLLAPGASAQFFEHFEISEVLVQPPAGGHVMVEVIVANGPFDTNSLRVFAGGQLHQVAGYVLQPGSVFVIHFGASGVSSPGHFWLPNVTLGLADSIALFRTTATLASQLVDYVGWGGGIGPHIGAAVQAGRWDTPFTSIGLPPQPGTSLANRRITRNTGNLVGPSAWYFDTTPTFGNENDPGATWWYGLGCANGPSIHPTSLDPGPWLGEQYAQLVPTATWALLVLSWTKTPPVPLDALGMPGCHAHLTLEMALLLASTGTHAPLSFVMPLDPLLVGHSLKMQAFVPGPPFAGSPLATHVTIAIEGLIGSR